MRDRLKDQNQSSNIVLLVLVTPLITMYPTVPTMQPDRLSLDSLPDKSPHLFNSTPSVCSTGFQLEMCQAETDITLMMSSNFRKVPCGATDHVTQLCSTPHDKSNVSN